VIAAKGGPGLQLVARRVNGAAGDVFVVDPGATLATGDAVRFVVDTGGARFVLVVSVDGAGQINVYYPFGGTASAQLDGRDRVTLDGSIVLDDAPGPERIWAVLSDRAVAVDELRAQLTAVAAGGASAIRRGADLVVPQAGQTSVWFEKSFATRVSREDSMIASLRIVIACIIGLAGLAGLATPARAETRRIAVLVGHNAGSDGQPALRWAEDDAGKLADVFVQLGDVRPADLFLVQGKGAARVRDAISAATRRGPRRAPCARRPRRRLLLLLGPLRRHGDRARRRPCVVRGSQGAARGDRRGRPRRDRRRVQERHAGREGRPPRPVVLDRLESTTSTRAAKRC